MKKILLSLSVLALFSLATVANNSAPSIVSIDCEHCKKDHTCDDKCKDGDKSDCCDDAKASLEKDSEATTTTSTTTKKACCKKGHQACGPKKVEEKAGEKDDSKS